MLTLHWPRPAPPSVLHPRSALGPAQDYLVDTILDDTLTMLTAALSVLPVTGNLVLNAPYSDASCFSGSYWYSLMCCDSEMPNADMTTGVAGTDFVLYVTARPTGGSTLAWALTCQSDQYQRPIAGHANFSPARISTAPADYALQVSTAWHEIVHALGFSSSKFGHFRKPGDITQAETYSNIVRTFTERGKSVTKIVTPNVVQKVREQYDCTDPWPNAGWELEDYGGPGTAGSHWEKRLGFNEVMTGTADPISIYSAITFALLEDSGWYSVDYGQAQPMPWGAGEGCDFPQLACSSWSSRYFCTGSPSEGCTVDFRYRATCNAISYGTALPSHSQYFAQPDKGGQNPYVDYCPYYERLGNGDCQNPGTPTYWFWGEVSGASSKCMTGTWKSSAAGVPLTQHNGCVQTTCTPTQQLKITLEDLDPLEVVCPYAGGTLDLSTVPDNADGRFVGVIDCPPSNLFCTGDPCDVVTCSGHGTCSAGTCTCTPGYYGDTATECDKRSCPNGTGGAECSGHGTCDTSTGFCVCDVGWGDSDCSEMGCPRYGFFSSPPAADPACGGGAACECSGRQVPGGCSDGVCTCSDGYWGDGCQNVDCPLAVPVSRTMRTVVVDGNTSTVLSDVTNATTAWIAMETKPVPGTLTQTQESWVHASTNVSTTVWVNETIAGNGTMCRGSDAKNEYGTCDGRRGLCECADILDFDTGVSAHSNGLACETYELEPRFYQELGFVGESIPGTNDTYAPAIRISRARQYDFFAFDAPDPEVAIELELRVLRWANGSSLTSTVSSSATDDIVSGDFVLPGMYVVYASSGQPNIANALDNGVTAITVSVDGKRRQLRLETLGSEVFYTASGRLHVGILPQDDGLVYSLELARDGCAVLTCAQGTCDNGFCTCPRASEDAGEGLTGTYGYAGTRCEVNDCPGLPDCGGAVRGTCVDAEDPAGTGPASLPTCSCHGIYSGSACQEYNVGEGVVVPGVASTEVSGGSGNGAFAVDVEVRSDTGPATRLGVPPNASHPASDVSRTTYTAVYSGMTSGSNVSVPFLIDLQELSKSHPDLQAPAGLFVRLNATGPPGSDPILLLNRDEAPSVTNHTHFDSGSWGQGASLHRLSLTLRDDNALYFVGVQNGHYATAQLSFTMYVEVSSGCPPALNDCNGNGVCSASSKLCECNAGWQGPACSIAAPRLNASQVVTTGTLAPGTWQYFSYSVPSDANQLRVSSTRVSGGPNSRLLLSTAFDGVNKRSIPRLTGSSVLFNFNAFVSNNRSQTLWLQRPSDTENSRVLIIGVLNTVYAKSAGRLSLSVTPFSASNPVIPASCVGDSADEAACSQMYCSGRGTVVENRGARVCQCQYGWASASFCASPRFSAFATLAASAQQLSFLCSVCSQETTLAGNTMKLMKVAQPLQKSTGLLLEVSPLQEEAAGSQGARMLNTGGGGFNSSSAGGGSPLGVLNNSVAANTAVVGNPSILVAQTLPRSLADFVFVSSSASENESLLLTEASPSGSYWVAVYANTAGTFSVQASRAELPASKPAEENFVEDTLKWLLESTPGHVVLGFAALLFITIILCCACSFCCGDSLSRALLGDEERLLKEKKKYEQSLRAADDNPEVQLPAILQAQRRAKAKRRWKRLSMAIKVGSLARKRATLDRLPVRTMSGASIPAPPPKGARPPPPGGAGGLMALAAAAGRAGPPPSDGKHGQQMSPHVAKAVAGFGPSQSKLASNAGRPKRGGASPKLSTAQLIEMSKKR